MVVFEMMIKSTVAGNLIFGNVQYPDLHMFYATLPQFLHSMIYRYRYRHSFYAFTQHIFRVHLVIISQLLGSIMIAIFSRLFHSTIICGGVSLTSRLPHGMKYRWGVSIQIIRHLDHTMDYISSLLLEVSMRTYSGSACVWTCMIVALAVSVWGQWLGQVDQCVSVITCFCVRSFVVLYQLCLCKLQLFPSCVEILG